VLFIRKFAHETSCGKNEEDECEKERKRKIPSETIEGKK
jgi:hypothetical protein